MRQARGRSRGEHGHETCLCEAAHVEAERAGREAVRRRDHPDRVRRVCDRPVTDARQRQVAEGACPVPALEATFAAEPPRLGAEVERLLLQPRQTREAVPRLAAPLGLREGVGDDACVGVRETEPHEPGARLVARHHRAGGSQMPIGPSARYSLSPYGTLAASSGSRSPVRANARR